MKATVYRRYGAPEVVDVIDLPRPEPTADRLVIDVRATAVTSGDARLRAARFPRGFGMVSRVIFGVRRPRRPVLGGVFSGVVVAGEGAGFGPGDQVAGMNGLTMGCHADYVRVAAKRLVAKPEAVSHEQAAAALFGGTTALTYLRDKVPVAAGQRVLVNGAAGSVGVAALQYAAHRGAQVTAVSSTRNAGWLTSLGANAVIDYNATPVAELADRFDVVFDAVGNLGLAGGRRLLRPGGRLCLVAADLVDTVRARGAAVAGPAEESAAMFAAVLDLVAQGAMDPAVDRVLPLERIVEAHRLVDSGHKRGNLVVVPEKM